VKLRREGVEECNLYVQADVQRLKQVLLNLMSNAVKYNRDKGTVEVCCATSSEGVGRITVSDTGRGIAADKMERLFEPFDRIDADKWGVEGVGLGLALSKRLAEAMGGKLQGESTLGEGSSFWVELPITEGQQLIEAQTTSPTELRTDVGSGPRGTVLYVEDNLSNAKLVQRILEQRRPGVELVEAMQGRLALDLARQHHPDLILLDLHLPDLSGAEVLRLLGRDSTTADIPVVVVSADATRSQVERLLEAGALDYVTKPIDVAALLAIVDQTVGRRTAGQFG
jgi:CheY-like chemotaxis protein